MPLHLFIEVLSAEAKPATLHSQAEFPQCPFKFTPIFFCNLHIKMCDCEPTCMIHENIQIRKKNPAPRLLKKTNRAYTSMRRNSDTGSPEAKTEMKSNKYINLSYKVKCIK